MGDAEFAQKLKVSGQATFEDVLLANDVVVSDTLVVGGKATFEDTATFQNNAVFNESIIGTDAHFTDTVGVEGTFRAYQDVELGSSEYEVSIESDDWSIGDAGDADFKTLNVHGSTTVSTSLTVGGPVNFSSYLSLTGSVTAPNFVATSSTATSTFAGPVSFSGTLLDGTDSSGISGYILQSIGTSTQWVATSSIGGGSWGSIIGTLSDQTDLQSVLDGKLSLSNWYATTTDALIEGITNKYYATNLFATDLAGTTTTALAEGTNLYYTDARGTANFISNLAATTSVASITTLANLSVTESQISDLTHYTNTNTNAYIHASTTIPKTYTANTFTGAQTLTGGLSIGSLSGFLKATAGSVATSTIDVTADITGTLPVANGGTGATTLSNLITLGTHTTGNYLATLADSGNSFFTVANSGTESAAVTLDIVNDSLNFAQLSDTLTLDASTDIAVDGSEVFSVTNTGTGNSFVVNDVASDTTPFVIDSSGNVGIGTTSPSTGLDVNVATDISGDVTISGGSTLTISATGPINQSGTGQVTFAGNVDAVNGLDVTNANLTVGGSNFSVAQATGNTQVGGTLHVVGAITATSTLAVSGATTLESTLQTSGALTAAGSGTGLSVTNNATVGGTLGVTGAATLSSTLDVSGTLTAGATTLSGVLALSSNKITGVSDPTSAQDAATKVYVDSVAQGLDLKASVRVVTSANIGLSGTQTIDDVALSSGDRVLVKSQTDATKNGIYVVASGAWARSVDADESSEVNSGMFTFAEEGTVNANSGWVLTTADPITVDTSALSFTQFSGAGQINAGTGLTKSGNTLDVIGTANRITANTDSIDIASTYVGQSSITTVGTLSSGAISSGFGAIDIGTSALTAGVATFSSIVGSAITGSGDLTISGAGSFTGNVSVAGTLSAAATSLSGNLVMNSNKITGLANPTSAQEAATKAYVDAIAQGLTVKASVRVATAANITLSGEQTIDGVAAVTGDRVLVKDQSTGSANGIYIVASGAWSRSTDADENSEVITGVYTFVEEGTAQANTGWSLITPATITLDSTSLTFTQFSGSAETIAGTGLTKSGNTINAIGTTDRITVDTDTIDIATTYVGQNTITTVGVLDTGSLTSNFGNINIGSSTLAVGLATISQSNAATAAATNLLTIDSLSDGTPASGLGVGILLRAEDLSGSAVDAGQIQSILTNVGTTAQASALTFATRTGGGSLTERLRIDDSGNLGIGDTSPDNKFDLLSTDETALAITSTGIDTDALIKFELTEDTPTFTIGVDDSDLDKFKISTTALGASDRFVIDSTGQIGIGDSSPSALLTIGAGDVFQINSSGAIAAATGITSSGTITLSSLTGGFLKTNGSGVIATSTIDLNADITGTLPVANGGTGATTLTGLLLGNGTSVFTATTTLVSSYIDDVYVFNTGDTISGDISVGTTTQSARLTVQSTGTSDILNLYETAGSEVFTVLESGDVGIGTTSPASHFEIVEDDGSNVIAYVTQASSTSATALARVAARNGYSASDAISLYALGKNYTTNGAFMQDSGALDAADNLSNGLSIISRAAGSGSDIRFYTAGFADGNQRMIIDESGNVGIGTTSPQTLLHAYADQNSPTDLRVQNPNTGTGAFAYLQAAASSGSTYVYQFGGGYTTSGRYIQSSGLIDGSGSGGLGLAASHASGVLHFYTNGNNERMTIDSTGNVGIGTTSPISILNIENNQDAGTEAIIVNTSTGTGAYARFDARNGPGAGDGTSVYTYGTGATTVGGFKQDGGILAAASNISGGLSIMARHTSGDIRFYTGGHADANQRMTIDSAGYVAIGTTTDRQQTTEIPFMVLNDTEDKKVTEFSYTGTHDPQTTGSPGVSMVNTSTSSSALGGFTFSMTDETYASRHTAAITVGKESGWTGSSDFPGYMSFWTRPTGGEDLERLRITADGNIGIGTTSPSSLFTVHGTGSGTGIDDFKVITSDGASAFAGNSVSFTTGSSGAVTSGTAGAGGSINLTTGAGGNASELGTGGTGGSINFTTGNEGTSQASTGTGGDINLVTGGTNIGGDIYLTPGGSSSYGDIIFGRNGGNVGYGLRHTNNAPSVPFDIDTSSNTEGLRLRGLAESAEIADFYLGSGGQLITDLTSGSDSGQYFDLRTEDDQYGLILRESDGTGTGTYANFYVTDNGSADYLTINVNSVADGDALVVAQSNNVGIGDTTPSELLDIAAPDTGSGIAFNGKLAIGSSDAWLRINQDQDFTSGTYTPGLLRTDGTFQVGSAGARFVVATGGNVGINDTSADYKLDVKGTICQDTDSNETCDGTVTSDALLKVNVADITSPLDTLLALRGVTFDWDETNPHTEFLGRGTQQVGVIAQEVEAVFPSLVYEDSKGYKMVDYQKLVAPLIEGVKELYEKLIALTETVTAFASLFMSDEIVAQTQFCIGETCISESDLKEILANQGLEGGTPSGGSSGPANSTASETTTEVEQQATSTDSGSSNDDGTIAGIATTTQSSTATTTDTTSSDDTTASSTSSQSDDEEVITNADTVTEEGTTEDTTDIPPEEEVVQEVTEEPEPEVVVEAPEPEPEPTIEPTPPVESTIEPTPTPTPTPIEEPTPT